MANQIALNAHMENANVHHQFCSKIADATLHNDAQVTLDYVLSTHCIHVHTHLYSNSIHTCTLYTHIYIHCVTPIQVVLSQVTVRSS